MEQDLLEHEPCYVWYINNPIRSVSLWRRSGGGEFPAYQNTRGRCIWNSPETGVTNAAVRTPTDAFWDAINQLLEEGVTEIDVEDCKWWERECIESLIGVVEEDEGPRAVGLLLSHAEEYHS